MSTFWKTLKGLELTLFSWKRWPCEWRPFTGHITSRFSLHNWLKDLCFYWMFSECEKKLVGKWRKPSLWLGHSKKREGERGRRRWVGVFSGGFTLATEIGLKLLLGGHLVSKIGYENTFSNVLKQHCISIWGLKGLRVDFVVSNKARLVI